MKKTNYTNRVNVDHVDPFFLYVFKITHKRNGVIEYNYKIGKADEPFKRVEDWKKEISSKLVDVEVEYIWTQSCEYHVGDYTYYMTKNERLTGNDADDIFRNIGKRYFGVDIYTLKTDEGVTVTDECGDFKTIDNDVVVGKLTEIFEKWKSLVDEYIANGDVDKCDIFVRYCHKDSKEEKKEFLEDRYEYQRQCADWMYDQMMTGNNDDCFLKVDCGGGKTSIVLDASTRVSKHEDNDYNPILVLSGLNSVCGAFKSDACKYIYHGHEVKVYDINKFNKSILKENKENHIISLICATVQSCVKTDTCDDVVNENSLKNKYVAKLSAALTEILKSGVRFSCGVTDEAHKIVFGEKMKEVFELIRSYHTKLNFIHMSGTGFSIQNNPLLNNKYEIDPADIRKEQGAAAVNRHIIVNRNPMFLPYFYSNIEKGWDMLLNDECDIDSGFEDIDSINCISTIESGLVKPVIGAYLQSIEYVRLSFDYLIKKLSFDKALIISANGGGGINGDTFVRNDEGGKVCKISDKNAHSEITTQIRMAVAANKMVILLNVNKFVESWTIKEMNVQLILRNISSPDMFGQTICRPTRVYKHLDHVIKKDAFIFLYGDTFVTMAYEYNNLLKQNSSKKTANPIKFLNDEDAVYMNGITYTRGNLNDLDKIIRSEVMRLNRSADGFSSLLMKKYPNAFKEIMERGERFFKDTATYGGRATINVIETPDTPNGERPDISDVPTDTPNGEKSDASDTPIEKNKNEEKKQLAQIKTFITNLQIEGLTSYCIDCLKYDNLVNCMKENAAKGNKVTECERMLSECFGDNYEEFKRDVECWLENWIETIN